MDNQTNIDKSNWADWLQANAQPTPRYFKPIKERMGYSATFLKPEQVTAFINAMSAMDAQGKPDYTPISMDYPTIGFNYKDFTNQGKEPFTVLASEPSWKYNLKSWSDIAKQYPKNYPRQYAPQAVYEHELAHYLDPRFNSEKMWSYPNRGYLTRSGLSGGTLQREMPAMMAEDEFWYNLMEALRSKR